MRRVRAKQEYYASLLVSSVSASRLTSPAKSPSVVSRSPPRSPVNIMRFGCPADIIVHVPRDVARLKLSAQRNLSMGHCTLQDLLTAKQPPLKRVELKDKERIIQELTSITVPMKSFKEVAPGKLAFSLGTREEPSQEELKNSILRQIQGKAPRVRDASLQPSLFPYENYYQPEVSLAPYRLNEVNAYQSRQSRSFLHAVKTQNYKEVRELLTESKLLTKEQDSIGLTALHWAVRRDDTAMVELLLHWGADPNATDMLKRTPLYLAVKRNSLKSVSLLMEKGADVTIASVGGSSPERLMKENPTLWATVKRDRV